MHTSQIKLTNKKQIQEMNVKFSSPCNSKQIEHSNFISYTKCLTTDLPKMLPSLFITLSHVLKSQDLKTNNTERGDDYIYTLYSGNKSHVTNCYL